MQHVVQGGGFRFLTEDPIIIALVRRCDELAIANEKLRHENEALRFAEIARFRTLRRDVKQIKRAIVR